MANHLDADTKKSAICLIGLLDMLTPNQFTAIILVFLRKEKKKKQNNNIRHNTTNKNVHEVIDVFLERCLLEPVAYIVFFLFILRVFDRFGSLNWVYLSSSVYVRLICSYAELDLRDNIYRIFVSFSMQARVCMCSWVMLLWMRLAHYNHIKTYIQETNETICIKNTTLVGTKLILHQVKGKKVKMTKSAIFSDNLNFFGNQVVFHMNLYPMLHWKYNKQQILIFFFFS